MSKKQTFVYLFVGLGITLTLMMIALQQNLNHFCETSEILAGDKQLGDCKRIGGIVVKRSVKRLPDGSVEFQLTDTLHAITVRYQGLLPDLFREGQGIIAVGELTSKHTFVARQVLAKHDENYTPLKPKALDTAEKNAHKSAQRNARHKDAD